MSQEEVFDDLREALGPMFELQSDEFMDDKATVHHTPSSEKTEINKVENNWVSERAVARNRSSRDKLREKEWRRDRNRSSRQARDRFSYHYRHVYHWDDETN